ncbi:hypothetical protein [Mesobacillus zeae]|uniref:Uncharacterized protein n=1 Tax=Mesobacillus zeae TaxID=1917180 RepID=A0A398BAK0_9BACI|nr:hypothetical protein [Mesobacillus zeae]RID84663.1 hypothetical protein D1970_12315 [Mesobacillus zeae]
MDNNNEQVISMLEEAIKGIELLSDKVEGIQSRLDRLEKVDSIEHRVTSNQIDISDIKETLERLEELQSTRIEKVLKEIVDSFEKKNIAKLRTIHQRLDSHLLKLGRMEEDMLIIKEDKPD